MATRNSTGTPNNNESPKAVEATISQAFGKVPDDVLISVRAGVEVLGWLDSICRCIEEETRKDEPRILHIRELAGAGKYLAADYGNCIDCEHEQMVDSLTAAGIEVTQWQG